MHTFLLVILIGIYIAAISSNAAIVFANDKVDFMASNPIFLAKLI
jgi:hypothetical protein